MFLAILNLGLNNVNKMEGIILDPVYTRKAIAGLIDLIKKANLKKMKM